MYVHIHTVRLYICIHMYIYVYVHACISTSHGYTYVCTCMHGYTYIHTYLNSTLWTVFMPFTHPPQLLVKADILPTLLLLLDHRNSAVQTNAAWALIVREGRKEGEGRGGEGIYQELPVLMNVVNNVHCFGSICRTCHTEVQGKSLHSF